MSERDTISGNGGAVRASSGEKAEQPRFEALRSGLVIRQYVIEEVIGAGGFGITYRAHHQRLTSKLFALKEYFPRQFAARNGTRVLSTVTGDDLFHWGLDRFLKEAETLARCQHSCIVDVVDYFEENGTAYAVLGYVEGQHMGQWLEQLGRPPTQEELDGLMMPLLDALEVVHAARLMHRDIAPDNIMIRSDGSPCLIDFGASREDVQDRAKKHSAIIKPGYSPPEQYHGIASRQGPWTDIYAVGATFYRAISGRAPLDSSQRSTLGDDLKSAVEIGVDAYRPGFLKAIDDSLRLQPEDRPQSVGQWRQMLLRDEPGIVPVRQGATDDTATAIVEASSPLSDSAPVAPGPVGGGGRPVRAQEPGRAVSGADAGSRVRKGPALVGAIALVALGGMAMAAYLRSGDPAPATSGAAIVPPAGSAEAPVAEAPKSVTLATPAKPSANEPAPPRPDPETIAAVAWAPLAASTDRAAIERFIELHGATSTGLTARQRLADLTAQAGAREAARVAAAVAEADRRRREQEAAQAERERFANAQRDREQQAAAQAERQRLVDEQRTREQQISAPTQASAGNEALWTACRSADEAGKEAACAPFIARNQAGPRLGQALVWRGVAYRKRGSHDLAIADFTKALPHAPRTLEAAGPAGATLTAADVYNNRGIARFLAGDEAGAIVDYGAAINLAPSNAEALNNRAWALFLGGELAKALRDADRSISIDGSKAYAYDTRGHIREKLGQRAAAIQDYQAALRLDAGQQASKDGLARLQAKP